MEKKASSLLERMNKFFKFEERNTNYRKEIIGGIVTFLAMVYILSVNPGIVSTTGMPIGAIFVASAVGAAIATLIMAFVANYPVALAPGMGVNAFFAFTICATLGYSWQEALAMSFIGGMLFFVISLTKFRQTLIAAIPVNLRYAIGAGIGLFIAFVGLNGSGIITSNPNTLVQLGDFSNPSTLLALFGIILISVLYACKARISKFCFIIAIVGTGVVGLILGLLGIDGMPTFTKFDYSQLKTIKDVAFVGVFEGFKTVFSNHNLLEVIFIVFSLLFVDIFDTLGTFVACARPAGLIDENGNLENIEKALIADATGTLVSSLLGTPEITTYVESSVGIESGARTGFSSLVVSMLFLISLFLYPIFEIFMSPSVTACALVLVGLLMMDQIKLIDWEDKASAISCFMTIILMLLSYSIADGIAFGFIFYAIAKLASGKAKEVHPLIYILSLLFIAYFVGMIFLI